MPYKRSNHADYKEAAAERSRQRRLRFTPPEKERPVPEGCISVWQIQSRISSKFQYHGVFRDFQIALTYATELRDSPTFQHYTFTVAHKAAVLLQDGRYHLVHFNPILFKNPDDPVTTRFSPDVDEGPVWEREDES